MSSIPKGLRGRVDALLAVIVPAYNVTSDGRLSTSNLSMRLYEGALIQLLNVAPSGLTAVDFEGCAKRALTATIKARTLSWADLDAGIEREIASFKRKRPLKFQVCSRCHVTLPPDYRIELELWGAKLKIEQDRPSELAEEQIEFSNGLVPFSEPQFGAYLTVAARGRTKRGALDSATSDISFLLGILNFTLNIGSLRWNLFNRNREFTTKIFPGREILLVKSDGMADPEVWNYYTTHPARVAQLTDSELSKLSQHCKVLKRLGDVPKKDRQFYREFFELYFDALSELDHDVITMRLWKAAEHITGATSAIQIANRLALTWPDKRAVSAVCFALGQRRNWIMHNAGPAPRIEQLPELFRHFLENAAWKSLATDVKSVAHWKAILSMSEIDIDLDLASDAVEILKALR